MKLRQFARVLSRRESPGLSERVASAAPPVRAALQQRLALLADVLDGTPRAGSRDPDLLLADLGDRLAAGREDEIWLALTVLAAELPDLARVQRVVRETRLNGAPEALDHEILAALLAGPADQPLRRVEAITDQVLVDIDNVTRFETATGIQRVARESGRRWLRDHDPVFVRWHDDPPALAPLSGAEAHRVLEDARQVIRDTDPLARPVVVPWRCTYVLPELNADLPRLDQLHAMLRFSGNSCGVIGFDCVPLTTAETVADGMPNGFARYLAAIAHADRVACISRGARIEYDGWREMLGGTGLTGPDTAAILLPAQAQTPTPQALAQARQRFLLGDLPLVLCVGSHEPRKNHLALLHAAELCWRQGLRFSLAFVGGRGWRGERFEQRVQQLMDQNRSVQIEQSLSDDELWAAYSLARFTVFPSLNEGFGLPVAESLASGAPVITSNFGSMAEIAADGGTLLVDPRDDHDIADALRRLLTDDALLERLRAEAAARPARTWEQYAAQTWQYLVGE